METVCNKTEGRPRVRWEDDVRNDLRKMGVANWKQRTQERKQWKEIIEASQNSQRAVELKRRKKNCIKSRWRGISCVQ